MGYWETKGKTDEWFTPKYIFDALNCHFDLDAAAPIDKTHIHVPASNFITENSLIRPWNGFVWLNPPFGGRNSIDSWIKKMTLHGDGIILTPDRTSTDWWQDAALDASVIFHIRGKIKFIRLDGTQGKSPSNGTTLFGYGKNAINALQNAQKNLLGICVKINQP